MGRLVGLGWGEGGRQREITDRTDRKVEERRGGRKVGVKDGGQAKRPAAPSGSSFLSAVESADREIL